VGAESLEERVASLEQKLKRKDGWDVAQIFISALTPIVLAIVGYVFTTSAQDNDLVLKKRDQELRDREFEYGQDKDLRAARLTESELLIKRSEVYRAVAADLFGPDGPKKELAIKILERIDPDSPELLKQVIAKSPATSQVASDAKSSLSAKRSEVVLSFFSDDRSTRIVAWDNIRRNWKEDVDACALILTTVESYRSNPDRVYNTAAILKFFSTQVLVSNRAAVEKFIASFPAGDPSWSKTAGELSLAKEKLGAR
jgi:hypothetical protein